MHFAVWLILAATCAVAAGFDVFLAVSMSTLWPVIAAVCALLAAVACVWVAIDEVQRAHVRLGTVEAEDEATG
jgi:hypothetical protein